MQDFIRNRCRTLSKSEIAHIKRVAKEVLTHKHALQVHMEELLEYEKTDDEWTTKDEG